MDHAWRLRGGEVAVPNDGSDPLGQQQSPEAERSGEDARRRGWFWHWNTIITQYAPLVGLKGVGLLNSYTVWTDRREESPHHGYAFPSQQAEADFYGEDRAELITINKILVTLGLIEIRKEMVLRVDERGRRWKVPHNLYRVRDHHDGYNLSVDHVLSVVELAARDQAVYRYVRRIFSPRFAPIDTDNVWHQILPVLREQESWRRLAERTLKEEERASARTKAGHAKRSKPSNLPANGESGRGSRQEGGSDAAPVSASNTTPAPADATMVAVTNHGSRFDVEPGNNDLTPVVSETNSGSDLNDATIGEQRNEGGVIDVDQTNRTYYENPRTTTTTTVPHHERNPRNGSGAGPLPSPSRAVVSCFEAANDRVASPLEIALLSELEATFDECAQRTGQTGGEWVIAAIREAVSSGSRFVAPKRVTEILNRWSNQADSVRPGVMAPVAGIAAMPALTTGELRLPGGRGARATWGRTLDLLARVLDPSEMERLFAGSAITDYRAGTITVRTATAEAAERLGSEYYELVSRKLAEAMRRSVRVEFFAAEPGGTGRTDPDDRPGGGTESGNVIAISDANRPAPPRSFVVSGGLTNQQVWSSALDALATRLTPATLETWVRPASIIGMEDDGTLVVGAPNAFAQRRLSDRLRDEIVRVLSELLGGRVDIRVVVAQEWLRQGQASGSSGSTQPES